MLGRNLVRLRKKKGFSQARLAMESGVSFRYFQKVEKGIANVSLDVVLRLRRGLGCKLMELLQGME